MSQNIINTGLPTPATMQDWTIVLEEAIQLASEDDQETADVKYAECQHWKQVKKECKAAEEVAACERVEAGHQEKECQDQEEHSYTVNSETEYFKALLNHQQSKMLVVDRLRASALVGDRPGMSVPVPAQPGNPGPAEGLRAKGKARAHDPVPVGPCAQCVRAGVECTFELARASKCGKKSCDQCSGLKEQCMLPGAEKKKEGQRNDKKKWAQAKSLEVEVQARSLRPKSVGGEMLVAQGLHAIMAAIDQHTNEIAKHQEMAKETQCMQRQFNNCLYKLLQEMEYQQVAEVGEFSDEESTSKETSDRETDKDAEGEEAPESDPEGYHKMKTKSCPQGTVGASIEGPEFPEGGDGGDMNRSSKYHEGTEVEGQGGGNECWSELWGAGRDQSCCLAGVHKKGARSGGPKKGGEEAQGENVGKMLELDGKEDVGECWFLQVAKRVPALPVKGKPWGGQSHMGRQEGEEYTRMGQQGSHKGQSQERQQSTETCEARFAESKRIKSGQQAKVGTSTTPIPIDQQIMYGECFMESRDGVCLELDQSLVRLTLGLFRGQLDDQEQPVTQKGARSTNASVPAVLVTCGTKAMYGERQCARVWALGSRDQWFTHWEKAIYQK
ncbi:hypothetical protein EDC04DRAFT_2597985 [Pisolithus marmoratus]|nr:hypothetical protein EDC04DRAFT_2597985 [Pisolithus marmoratus]